MHAAAKRRYLSKEEALKTFAYLKEQGLDINAIYLITDFDSEIYCLQETPLFRAARYMKSTSIHFDQRTEQDYYAIEHITCAIPFL